VKKRATPQNDTPSELDKLKASEQETAPLDDLNMGPGSTPSEGDSVKYAVEDITDSILPQHISEEGLNQLQEELQAARKQADENLDGWQRALAEFANYKKRIDREREEERSRIAGEIILHYLCILDDFERALKERPQDHEMTSWAEGIDLIYRKLKNILETEGVEVIPTEGEIFNPTYHEALSQEESCDHHEGEIIEVIQQGYKIGDRVLRPALVRIAK